MTTDKRIEVVAAVIVREGRVLLQQRHPTRSDFGLLWESPGGKVELGEEPCRALARELREELGLVVDGAAIGSVLASFDFEPPVVPRPLRVSFHHVDIDAEVPRLLEAAGLGWFRAAEIAVLAMAPANVRFRERLMKYARQGDV